MTTEEDRTPLFDAVSADARNRVPVLICDQAAIERLSVSVFRLALVTDDVRPGDDAWAVVHRLRSMTPSMNLRRIHPGSCPCCMGRGPLAVIFDTLFRDLIRQARPSFVGVVVRVSSMSQHDLETELGADPLIGMRFFVADAARPPIGGASA